MANKEIKGFGDWARISIPLGAGSIRVGSMDGVAGISVVVDIDKTWGDGDSFDIFGVDDGPPTLLVGLGATEG
mgnify:CR=1 FL=1